jgi:hypothetical protein
MPSTSLDATTPAGDRSDTGCPHTSYPYTVTPPNGSTTDATVPSGLTEEVAVFGAETRVRFHVATDRGAGEVRDVGPLLHRLINLERVEPLLPVVRQRVRVAVLVRRVEVWRRLVETVRPVGARIAAVRIGQGPELPVGRRFLE